MIQYTIEQLIGMDDEALGKTARLVFSMQLDPFSELGKRTMRKRLEETKWIKTSERISPALKVIIGSPTLLIENILDYQRACLSLSVDCNQRSKG